jgi:cyclophilin family peptidyl-prolyl cis-trans isomerase
LKEKNAFVTDTKLKGFTMDLSHHVINDFLIQTGDPTGSGQEEQVIV